MDVLEPITERLLLRQWSEEDRDPFAALNADPVVMEHFPAPLTRAQSDAQLDRCAERLATDGYGLWALEMRDTGKLIGFAGFARPSFEAPFTPCTELGWRLAHSSGATATRPRRRGRRSTWRSGVWGWTRSCPSPSRGTSAAVP